MATIQVTFPGGFLAWDPVKRDWAVNASGGKFYLATDRTQATPLPITDMTTGNLIDSVSSDSQGRVSPVSVAVDGDDKTNLDTVCVFGDYATPLQSMQAVIAYLQPQMDQIQTDQQTMLTAVNEAKQSANTSAQAAQAVAQTVSKPTNDAINAYLVPAGSSDTAAGLVGRVATLENNPAGGQGQTFTVTESNGQLPVGWNGNTPVYGSGTPMRPTDDQNSSVIWRLFTLPSESIPNIAGGTAGALYWKDTIERIATS